jgi:hypothetical protein
MADAVITKRLRGNSTSNACRHNQAPLAGPAALPRKELGWRSNDRQTRPILGSLTPASGTGSPGEGQAQLLRSRVIAMPTAGVYQVNGEAAAIEPA